MKFVTITAALVAGTAGIVAAQDLVYLDSAIVYSNQDRGFDEEVNFWVGGYFKAGDFTFGGEAVARRDRDDSSASFEVFEASLGYQISDIAYIQYIRRKYDDVSGNKIFTEFDLGQPVLGVEYLDNDTNLSRIRVYGGYEAENGAFYGGAISNSSRPNGEFRFVDFFAEAPLGSVETTVIGSFGLNGYDFWEIAAAAEYNLNDNLSLMGGLGAVEFETGDGVRLASVGLAYDLTDTLRAEALLGRAFPDDANTLDTIGVALTWALGSALSINERFDDIAWRTWGAVRAYD